MSQDALDFSSLIQAAQYEKALELAVSSEALARSSGDQRAVVAWMVKRADALRLLERNDDSLAIADAATVAARESRDQIGESDALRAQSDALYKLDRNEESMLKAEAAEKAAHAAGSQSVRARALRQQADALKRLGRYEESLAKAIAAEKAARSVEGQLEEIDALRAQADALYKMDRYDESLARAEAAQAIARSVGDRRGEASALHSQANVLCALGRYADSLTMAEAAEEAACEAGRRWGEANALLLQAILLRRLRRNKVSLAKAEAAAALFAAIGQNRLAAYATWLADCVRRPPSRGLGAGSVIGRLQEEFVGELQTMLSDADHREHARHQVLRAHRGSVCPAGTGRLHILRQWPSYVSVSLLKGADETAGGYLLRWGEKNLVIDPGLGFLDRFRAEGFRLADLDGVVITHWHIDHTGDMDELLTCLFEAQGGGFSHKMDFILSPSAFAAYSDRLAYHSGVGRVILLRDGETLSWGEMDFVAVGVHHVDLTGRSDGAIGLRVTLLDAEENAVTTLGFTSDAAWRPSLAQGLDGADLLVVHLGGIYAEDFGSRYASNHLGLKGSTQLISRLAKRGLRIAVLSEIGKELERNRVRIATMLTEACGCSVLPGELGMRISLPELTALCDGGGCDRPATQWGENPEAPTRLCFRCGSPGCPAPVNPRPTETKQEGVSTRD